MRGDVSTACTYMGSRPWRTRSRRSMRFGGTIMSITLTELSRVKAPGNSRKGCSQRPQAHSRSGPRNPVLSKGHSLRFQVVRRNPAGQGHGMLHGLPERFDLDRWLARWQQGPVGLQLRTVNLGPCLDESHLGLGHCAAEHLKRIDGHGHRLFLLVLVKMRAVVKFTDLDEHSDHDTEEPRQRWHVSPYIVGLGLVGITRVRPRPSTERESALTLPRLPGTASLGPVRLSVVARRPPFPRCQHRAR